MEIFLLKSLSQLRSWCATLESPLQFVPTMGCLHDGHAELIRRASGLGPVLVSIFVNPLQFCPGEDYDCYPRNLEADQKIAKDSGAEAIWIPSLSTVYPQGEAQIFKLQVPFSLQQHLCGAVRPGHFDGVATVITRLLSFVRPNCIWLGEKDWQQLVIIRRLITDLGLPVAVRAIATVREVDGLAFSSRNQYLSEVERKCAGALPLALNSADFDDPVDFVWSSLNAAGLEVEYVERVNPFSLQPCGSEMAISLLAAAVRCGSTRLIDNVFIMSRKPVVSIDGPAGAGKSTVTRAFADRLGLVYLDTGAMYRSVAWLVRQREVDHRNVSDLQKLLENLDIQLNSLPGGKQEVLVNGEDVSTAIRSPEVTELVPSVSSHRCVRQALTKRQKSMGEHGGIVAEGRDIGTVVFPHADLKIFLTASVGERARRRALDMHRQGFKKPNVSDLEVQIAERDRLDSIREESPLVKAEDAIEIITDGMNINKVIDSLVEQFRCRVSEEAWPTPH